MKQTNLIDQAEGKEATDVYTLLGTVPLNGLIVVHERIAKVVKKWNNECWRLKFTDNNEIVNVFYPLSEDWHCG
tara:strand:- start:173 stop:394 length:222 start_codon:yes stop_codon:yes gene_type:complete